MTESDIAAIRDALAAGPSTGGCHIYTHPRDDNRHAENFAWHQACSPERIDRLLDALEAWHTALSAVMPPDFKDWHQNDKAEWPAVAAGVIQNLRRDRDAAWDALESAQKDAERYRWLRDAHPATEAVIAMDWRHPDICMRHEALDAAIDAAMRKGL